jgi:hypothetical protein
MSNTMTVHINQTFSHDSIRGEDIELFGEIQGEFFVVNECIEFIYDDVKEDWDDVEVTPRYAVDVIFNSIPTKPHMVDNTFAVMQMETQKWFKVVYKGEDGKLMGLTVE